MKIPYGAMNSVERFRAADEQVKQMERLFELYLRVCFHFDVILGDEAVFAI